MFMGTKATKADKKDVMTIAAVTLQVLPPWTQNKFLGHASTQINGLQYYLFN